MKTLLVGILSSFPALLLGCAAPTTTDPGAQTTLEALAAEDPSILRLTLHRAVPGVEGPHAVASTLAAKLGKPSDPEDIQAMATGQEVVLDEAGAIDVTIPIRPVGGKHTAAVGVTLDGAMGRAAAVAKARAIAARVGDALR